MRNARWVERGYASGQSDDLKESDLATALYRLRYKIKIINIKCIRLLVIESNRNVKYTLV